ncbi:MAG: selenide, water dikinase SelD [Candidatus Accumulibacter sp.]|jgi:selenide,water dikinase|uniref:selenide, water dikinase SelD n=1 Tax=unclassified Candidatus Accumulibacter TaxID=2619054 RepID=UPI0012C3EFD3|nr:MULTISPECIES: selenide, water dikinase SelD [unclassified Candidatus Accumulibacter]MBL8368130.1 selenide, water dikinase SelD [Accumulibacter sp.]MQM33041.1 selenide, water dikinase SelD [Candidatus Accumulibacter phosphatis]HRE86079.1 selenide, water dikinase SelD [Accumulibacter sp.]
MHSADQAVFRDIVLVGGGHSHVVVLRRFAMRPLPGVRLTVICSDTHTPYSGMLPGYIAGHYSHDEVHIDLRRLAEFAGARYFREQVIGLDRVQRKVLCARRPPVAYDRLSINIGSMPAVNQVEGAAEHAIPVKPIRRFNEHWLALLERVREHRGAKTIAIVGAGAGGVELSLAMHHRLRNELRRLGRDPGELRFHLFSAEPEILPTHNARVRRAFEQVLAERAVVVHRDAKVSAVASGQLRTAGGETLAVDEIVWVTQAGGADWLRDTGLALDDRGFIQVRDSLQTVSDAHIFAAGDCASMIDRALEKAGVFAVRQGRPLADNLRRSVLGQPLRAYHPQARWLALISTGDRYAIASRGGLHTAGAWVWRWKDWIDRRFMARFNDLPAQRMAIARPQGEESAVPLDEAESAQAISALAMRCGGCGAKVGATVLSRALASVHPVERDDVLIGLHAPDDAAVVRVPPGRAMVHTVDFFRALIDDPWLFGRIAANHALGDIFAMGGEAQSATAIATVPPGLESQVEETLLQMMAGAVEVLNEAGCALVGGHSGEGRELALGFAINGLIDEGLAGVMCKGGMRPGDQLILGKPIGTGTLLAAHARLQAKGRWIDDVLASMEQSNRLAASCLREHGATACTDLTGFGLLGHLVEMTRASGVDAEIDLAALPVLEGAAETSAAGILSSLQPANLRLRRALRGTESARSHPNYALLFDPQTAGGLLASVPAERAAACIAALRSLGYGKAACIGRVLPPADDLAPIHLK